MSLTTRDVSGGALGILGGVAPRTRPPSIVEGCCPLFPPSLCRRWAGHSGNACFVAARRAVSWRSPPHKRSMGGGGHPRGPPQSLILLTTSFPCEASRHTLQVDSSVSTLGGKHLAHEQSGITGSRDGERPSPTMSGGVRIPIAKEKGPHKSSAQTPSFALSLLLGEVLLT